MDAAFVFSSARTPFGRFAGVPPGGHHPLR